MKLTRSKSIFPWNQPQLFVYEFGSFFNSFGRCVYLLSPFEAWSRKCTESLTFSSSVLLLARKTPISCVCPETMAQLVQCGPNSHRGCRVHQGGRRCSVQGDFSQQHYWLSPDRIGWYCCGAELHSTQHPILPKCSRIHKSRPSSSPAGSRPLYQVFITG